MDDELKQYKPASFALKDLNDSGEFIATIATLNRIDLDGDVTLPGAFPNGAEVNVAAWGHNWGALPVGIATIREDGDEVRAHGKFFIEATHGRDTWITIKGSKSIQEWSYGFFVKQAEAGTWEGEDVRLLKALDVAEVSPVMRGAAGTGFTRTEDVKSSFGDNAEAVLAAVQSFTARARSLAGLRAKDGRALSGVNRGRIERVHGALADVMPELEELLALAQQATEGGADDGKAAAAMVDLRSQWEYVESLTAKIAS